MTLRRVTWSALTFLPILVVACGGSIDASPENDAAGSGTGGTKADGGTTGTGGAGRHHDRKRRFGLRWG